VSRASASTLPSAIQECHTSVGLEQDRTQPTAPFSRFSGNLKSLRLSSFDETAKKALEFAFPQFFRPPTTQKKSRDYFRRIKSRLARKSQTPYAYRRFAGDSSLSRNSYYSVSDDSEGNDKRTLLYELMTYNDPSSSGAIIPFDSVDERHRDDVARHFGIPVSRYENKAIIVLFIDDDKDTLTPIFRSGALHKDKNNTAVVSLPYEVESKTVDKVIDLRRPATQDWFAQSIFSGLPQTDYWYGSHAFVKGLRVGKSRPNVSDYLDRQHDAARGNRGNTLVSFAPCSWWNGEILQGPESFIGLIPYLTFPAIGGSPITEAIGAWLRRIGANGLVYPSARNNIEVIVKDGEVKRSGGWNFVDFRGSPPPEDFRRLIFEPDSWSSLEGYSEPDVAIEGSTSSGSWRFVGRADRTVGIFRRHQLALAEAMSKYYQEQGWDDPETQRMLSRIRSDVDFV
jgi:hypothetical protein